MHWTFDPLQSRNAYVNFSKLGIVSRQYVQEMYGHTDSPLHDGVGTDRLVATWEMESDRVQRRLAGEEPGPNLDAVRDLPRVLRVEEEEGLPAPGRSNLDGTDSRLLLNVPGDIDRMMGENLQLAILWREATRPLFLHYLAQGYEVREFVRFEGVSGYVLERQAVPGVRGGAEGGDEMREEGSGQ
jgi:predicted GNAT superfamily acetyltransferase